MLIGMALKEGRSGKQYSIALPMQNVWNDQGSVGRNTGSMRLIIVSFIALAVRLLWAWRVVISRDFSGYTGIIDFQKTGDAGGYLVLARNLYLHHVFSFAQGLEPLDPTYFRAPGYPAFIAALGWPPSFALLFLVQAIAGTITAAITFKLAEPFGRHVALIAGLAMALAPMSVFYTTEIMSETLYTTLVVSACYLWFLSRAVWSGFVFGLSWLVRPTTMGFLIFAFVAVFLIRGWNEHRKTVVIICFSAILTVLPWVVRNFLIFHKFIPVATAGGRIGLLSGTFDISYGKDVWRQWYTQPELETGYGWSDPRSEDIYLQRAVQRIMENPLGWLRVRAKQYPWLFIDLGSYLHPSNAVAARFVKWGFLIGNALVLLLAVLGGWLSRSHPYLVIFPFFLVLFHLPLWIEPRYSLPMVPMMIILALFFISRARSRFRTLIPALSATRRVKFAA